MAMKVEVNGSAGGGEADVLAVVAALADVKEGAGFDKACVTSHTTC